MDEDGCCCEPMLQVHKGFVGRWRQTYIIACVTEEHNMYKKYFYHALDTPQLGKKKL
jgi:hypothetical protein